LLYNSRNHDQPLVRIVSFGATKNFETREGNVYVRVTSERGLNLIAFPFGLSQLDPKYDQEVAAVHFNKTYDSNHIFCSLYFLIVFKTKIERSKQVTTLIIEFSTLNPFFQRFDHLENSSNSCFSSNLFVFSLTSPHPSHFDHFV
jgi:hypothetical protein